MKDDGGPAMRPPQAFPSLSNVGYNSDWICEDGMSLRDYFAGQALRSIIGVPTSYPDRDAFKARATVSAENAYMYADALLAERKKGQDDAG